MLPDTGGCWFRDLGNLKRYLLPSANNISQDQLVLFNHLETSRLSSHIVTYSLEHIYNLFLGLFLYRNFSLICRQKTKRAVTHKAMRLKASAGAIYRSCNSDWNENNIMATAKFVFMGFSWKWVHPDAFALSRSETSRIKDSGLIYGRARALGFLSNIFGTRRSQFPRLWQLLVLVMQQPQAGRERTREGRGAPAPTERNKYRDDGAYLSITAEIPP